MISPSLTGIFPPGHGAPVADTARAALSRKAAQHDADLARRFNNGDADAFVELMTRHRARLFAVAFRLVRNYADAEEVTQDTFIRAHRGLANFRGDASVATWLHRIALNLARNRYWYSFRRCCHATVSLDAPLQTDSQATFQDLMAGDDAGPVHSAVTAEFSALVTSCMNRLGRSSREILTLRNIMNQSYAEISIKLGLSPGTVKSRIARAREQLRTLLAETCPDFGPEARPSDWLDPVRSLNGTLNRSTG